MVARSDKASDPALVSALLLARRGQAYFSRKLNELPDADFSGASLLPGWSRAHVISHVGHNARAIARLVAGAANRIVVPMYPSPEARQDEIDFGASLPTEALRNLSDHAAVHLSVEWRDLADQAWAFEVITGQGRLVPVSETVWMRTREVWLHAVDLANGGSVHDFPADLIDRLLEDLVAVWRRKQASALTLVPVDRDRSYSIGEPDVGPTVHGTAVELVAWGTGRGTAGVLTADGMPPGPAPAWL